MAGSNKLVTLGLVAGGGYLAYQMGWLAPLGLSPAAVAAPAAKTPASGSAPATAANKLDSTFALMVSKANAPSAGLTVDEWNWFLMQSLPNFTAPDPMPLFQAVTPGFDRATLVSAADYWKVMAPWLKTNAGLSGLGPRGLGWMWEVRA